MSSAAGPERESSPRPHAAGAFDIRNIIGGLIGVYGIVLVVVGLVGNAPDDQQKTGDVNANLWSGIVMVAVGIGFLLWTRLRPLVVDPGAAVDREEDREEDRAPGH